MVAVGGGWWWLLKWKIDLRGRRLGEGFRFMDRRTAWPVIKVDTRQRLRFGEVFKTSDGRFCMKPALQDCDFAESQSGERVKPRVLSDFLQLFPTSQ